MLVLTLMATAAFYLALYPARSKWGIENARMTGLTVGWHDGGFVFNVSVLARVFVANANVFGAELERARYEIFGSLGPVVTKRDSIYLGEAFVGPTKVAGKSTTSMVAEVKLISIDFSTALRLLYLIFKNGSLPITALGSAQVTSLDQVHTLVGIRCDERIDIHLFSLYTLATLDGIGGKSCVFTYQPLPKAIKDSPILPLLDRRYLFARRWNFFAKTTYF